MTHLGERVCELVDGQLDPEAAERAHAHLVSCRGCRDQVEAERLMKARLAAMVIPAPGEDLVQRLIAMGGPGGPVPPREGYVPGTARPRAVSVSAPAPASPTVPAPLRRRPAGPRRPRRLSVAAVRPSTVRSTTRSASGASRVPPAPRPGAVRGRRVRLTVAVLGALGAVGAGVGVLTVGGAPSAVGVVPSTSLLVLRQAVIATRIPVLDVPAGWQFPRRGGESNPRPGAATGP